MNFQRAVTRRLHEEHDATLALWGRVERSLSEPDAETIALLRRAAKALDEEIARHFRFEEEALFPRLAEAGDGDLGDLLTEEHVVIREAADRLAACLSAESFEGPAWTILRAVALEIAEILASHVHKEEMSLLPALDDALDESADDQLSLEYMVA